MTMRMRQGKVRALHRKDSEVTGLLRVDMERLTWDLRKGNIGVVVFDILVLKSLACAEWYNPDCSRGNVARSFER